MASHSPALWKLMVDLYSPAEVEAVRLLVQSSPFDYDALVDFDRQLGGPSMETLSVDGHGRYAVADRDVFRPLQYCATYFGAEASVREWHSFASLLVRLAAWLTRLSPRGMYEILDYDSTLELLDPHGHTAIFHKRQQVCFRQDNIIAFPDYAWGDGEIFADYRCSPGVAVDRYQDGDRWNILISLRETKSCGDITDFHLERTVRDGFVHQEEWYQAEIRHPTRRLRLAVIFPAARQCQRATLHERKGNRTHHLGPEQFQQLPDGRQLVAWETRQVRDLEMYTLRWVW